MRKRAPAGAPFFRFGWDSSPWRARTASLPRKETATANGSGEGPPEPTGLGLGAFAGALAAALSAGRLCNRGDFTATAAALSPPWALPARQALQMTPSRQGPFVTLAGADFAATGATGCAEQTSYLCFWNPPWRRAPLQDSALFTGAFAAVFVAADFPGEDLAGPTWPR